MPLRHAWTPWIGDWHSYDGCSLGGATFSAVGSNDSSPLGSPFSLAMGAAGAMLAALSRVANATTLATLLTIDTRDCIAGVARVPCLSMIASTATLAVLVRRPLQWSYDARQVNRPNHRRLKLQTTGVHGQVSWVLADLSRLSIQVQRSEVVRSHWSWEMPLMFPIFLLYLTS
jgi:hypothetical protein